MFYTLLFGVLSWLLPIVLNQKLKNYQSLLLSQFFCLLAIITVFLEIKQRILSGDFAGFYDTINIDIVGVVIMISINVIINTIIIKTTNH